MVQRIQTAGTTPSVTASLPRWARAVVGVAVAVMWVPFLAVPILGYVYFGWWGAVLSLAAYAAFGWLLVLMRRFSKAPRGIVAPVELDTSDPRWRNLMP
jgi:cytochrome b561